MINQSLPAPIWVPTGDLIPNPGNPRFIKDHKFKRLVKSVKESPWMLKLRPIIATRENIVLGGNMRLTACKAADIDMVPVIYADDLTPSQVQEFIIKDNIGYGEWDWELLANEWDVDVLKDWDLDIPDLNASNGPKDETPKNQYYVVVIAMDDTGKPYPHHIAVYDNRKMANKALTAFKDYRDDDPKYHQSIWEPSQNENG